MTDADLVIDAPAPSDDERLHKAAVDLLIAKGEEYASAVLLSCNVHVEFMVESSGGVAATVRLSGPPVLFHLLRSIGGLEGRNRLDGHSHTGEAIRDALASGVRHVEDQAFLDAVWVDLDAAPPFPGWREEYIAELRGDKAPLNQGVVGSFRPAFEWNGLRFRSRTEEVLAQAFSRSGVLFFPLAAAVSRQQRFEPDFLVCHQGKWGILEVHGDDFHPPETAAREHERGRWFQELGVKVFQVFNATDCYSDPDGVVGRFLKLLAAS